ncbi:hypothetical protein Tco_0002508 [Tanacetum coccineum]
MGMMKSTRNERNNGKYLSVVESSKATDKDYTKLLVTDEMLEYVFAKYGNKWHLEDDIADVILEDLWMKYGKYDKGKGKVHDLENIIEKLEVDKEAKHAEHAQLKVNKDDKGKGKVQAENDQLKVNKKCLNIQRDPKDLKLPQDKLLPLPQDPELSQDKLLPLLLPKLPQDKLLPLPLIMHKLLQLQLQEGTRK